MTFKSVITLVDTFGGKKVMNKNTKMSNQNQNDSFELLKTLSSLWPLISSTLTICPINFPPMTVFINNVKENKQNKIKEKKLAKGKYRKLPKTKRQYHVSVVDLLWRMDISL